MTIERQKILMAETTPFMCHAMRVEGGDRRRQIHFVAERAGLVLLRHQQHLDGNAEAVEIAVGPGPPLPLEVIADRHEQHAVGDDALRLQMFEQPPPLAKTGPQQACIEQLVFWPARLQLVKPRAAALAGCKAVTEYD